MKTWVWVLLLVAAVVLFLWSTRHEGFQSTPTLHGPPYGGCTDFKEDGTCKIASDYDQIVGMMSSTLISALKVKNQAGDAPVMPPATATSSAKAAYQNALVAYQRKLVDGIISSTMGEFYTKYYQPATVSVTSANVDTFMGTYMAQIQTTSPSVYTFLSANKADVSALLVAYFVTQPAGAANGPLLGSGATAAQQAAALVAAQQAEDASAVSGYDAVLAALGQGAAPNPTCPAGYTISADFKTCSGAAGAPVKTPSCSTGFTFTNGLCRPETGAAAGGAGSTGNTTGGSSVTPIPNSGTNKGNIWGPAFTGFGTNAGFGAMGARDYPTLIGPKPKQSTYVAGAGVIRPSQSQNLLGSGAGAGSGGGAGSGASGSGSSALPSAAGTGSDPNSQFFGSSRVPGDRDLIPDSNQEFTPSIGSSKTEPVPYLADFSAFTS